MSGSKSRYIPALDGLRAFAVLAVIAYHMNFSWAQGGLLGVTVFFVLSGYLITGLLVTEWAQTKTIDLKNFWLRRVRRLVPAIVFVIIVVAALCTVFNHELLTKMRPDIPPALLFFSNWWYIFHDLSYFEALGAPSPLNHFWSLAIEEQFYLVWPVALLAAFKLGAKRPLLRRIAVVLAAASALAMAFLYNPIADPSRVYYGTDTRAFSLLIGAWLAFKMPASRMGKVGARLTKQGRMAMDGIGIAAFAGLVLMVAFTDGFSPFLYWGGLVIASVLTAVVIAVIANPRSRFGSIASARPLVWIGKRSYGMYLWHYPVLLLMNPGNATGEINLLYCLVQLAAIFAVSAFSFKFIEDPIRKGAIGTFVKGVRSGEINLQAFAQKHLVALASCGIVAAMAIGGIAIVPPTSAVEGIDEMKTSSEKSRASLVKQQMGLDVSLMPLIGDRHVGDVIEAPKPDPVVKKYNPVMIGDSVSVRTVPYFEEAFPDGLIDAQISRQFYTAKSVFDPYDDAGVVGKTVVFALGTNGVATDDQIDELVAEVGENRQIYFITARAPESWIDATNAALAAAADRYENVHLIDWSALSAGQESYFDGDGTHLTEEGARVYVDMIKQALEG
ncbi:acyltransferase family protein [Raoultibacter timonensis]|uniref:acyltransferase family protein n=1 Tax=Raoultibacter timonensis TaxID=1907662 RepID=UPI000C8304BD|nr:acyltransferase family protein [Raoultibacter timonensis]